MYQKMYTTLFNAITDALELMEKGSSAEAALLLKQAQQSTEDQYINAADETPGHVHRILTFKEIGHKRRRK